MAADSALHNIFLLRAALIKSHAGDTGILPHSLLSGYVVSFIYMEDTARIYNVLAHLYDANKAAFDKMINSHLRPSGYYQLFAAGDNKEFLLNAWRQVIASTNHIINQFGLGKKFLYPDIDSARYNVDNPRYWRIPKEMFGALLENKMDSLFFTPSLFLALKLMDINGRDDPDRYRGWFEPLQDGINKAACAKITTTKFSDFKYSAILIPGSGPNDTTTALSNVGKMRCDTAAMRFNNDKWLAPFIIVSGGYVHPYGTKHCEAFEMKNYLMTQYHIPDSAIIAEPDARHTTTNIRNANRLIIRYGIPFVKPVLVISTPWHIEYITGAGGLFFQRNMNELGYLPFGQMAYIPVSMASYIPSLLSLQMNPEYPLDP